MIDLGQACYRPCAGMGREDICLSHLTVRYEAIWAYALLNPLTIGSCQNLSINERVPAERCAYYTSSIRTCNLKSTHQF
jgi:hypothetical protein